MAKTLAQFGIKRSGEDYLLSIEDSNGDTVEYTVDYDQLDVMTEAIEEALDADEEEELGVDGEEEAEEE